LAITIFVAQVKGTEAMRISTGWVKAASVVMIGCGLITASVFALVYSTSDQEQSERERYDQPGEAAQFYRIKRLPEGETELPIERYLEAQEQMRDLPVYSTVHNQLLPSRRSALSVAPSSESALLDGWKPLGPGNLGGRTRALLIHPGNPDVIYAAAAAGGIWKTTDGGRSWRPIADLLPNIAVNAMAMDPANPDVLYAGTGEGYFNSDAIRGAGIFKSYDGGATWNRLESTATANFHYVNDIVISHNRSNRIYAATRAGIMRSLDGGASWTRVHDADRVNGGCLDLAIRTDQPRDYIFAACGTAIGAASFASVQSSIYRHTKAEEGLSGWESVFTEAGMGRTSLAIAPSNQDVIYAVSADNGAGGMQHGLHAVFRSTNSGNNWTAQVRGNDQKKLNTLLFTNPIFALNNECYGKASQFYHQGWYNNVIAVDPKNENIVWVGGVDLFRSDDGGLNWGMASFWHLSPANQRYVHADHHAIAFHPRFDGTTNSTMLVGNDGGIFRTENSRAQTASGERAACSPEASRIAWTSLNNGYSVTQFYHGVPFPNGAKYIGGTQDNGVVLGSDEAGENGWKTMVSGDGGCVAVDWTDPRVVYAATTGLSLRKSTNGGQTFNNQFATTGISNIGFNFIVPFVMDPSDPARLWMGGKQMWRSRDGARNWTQASADLTDSATAIAVAPADPNFVLAGTKSGQIHRTTIGSNSNADTFWPSATPRDGYVSSLAFDPVNRDVAYATYSTFGGKHVWRSLDGGASWHPIDGSVFATLPDIPVNCIVVDPTNTQRLYIGTDLGVFVSIDGGATWAVENTGFANVPVASLAVNIVGYTVQLFAFTHGRGAWRVQLGCSSSVSPTHQMVNVEGGAGQLNVTASGSECPWTAESNSNWITITGDPSGRGSATVTYSVAPNPQASARTGTIIVAGKSVTIVQAAAAVSVSAASLLGGKLAPESIVSAFGAGLAETTMLAGNTQLPTNLANTVVIVKDSSGAERRAPLFFVSPNQINYLMPKDVPDGPTTVMIFSGNDGVFSGNVRIVRAAPGLFTANASGQGAAVGQALRVKANGAQVYEPLAIWSPAQNRFIPNPIDVSVAGEQVFLILYGTGLRFRSALSAVTVKIGGVDAPIQFAGELPAFAGLDQVNVLVPRTLAGRGEMDLALTVDGQQANIVRISIK
jgi:uncharacterized protein (TIGR03437 family)